MPDLSPNLSMPFIQPAQAQKHVTHNEAIQILDAVVQLGVVSMTETMPPAGAQNGVRYIVPAGAAGVWTDRTDMLAMLRDGAWIFFAPQLGWRAYVADAATDVVWHGSAWQAAGFDNLPGVGVNTVADAVNRFAVAADASLLTHEGAGHQLKINKAAAGDTASVLFQTGFGGRAEMGTAGTDGFSIKVSADGNSWATALAVSPAGQPDLAAGASVDGQSICHRGNLLGSVSEAGGQPTGAVIERGSTPDGEYIRFADGTQICTAVIDVDITTAAGAVFFSGAVVHPFPQPFIDQPAGSGSMANTVNGWVNGRAGNATQWTCSAYSYSARTGDRVQLLAVGRWF